MRNIISTILVAFFQRTTLLFFAVWIILLILKKVRKQDKLKVFVNIFMGLFFVSLFFNILMEKLPFCDSWAPFDNQEAACECQGVKVNYIDGEILGMPPMGGSVGNKCLGVVKSSKKIEWWKNSGNQFQP
jgi:hypothetical protein